MRTIIFNSLVVLLLISCTNNDSVDLTIYNPDLSIVQNLDNGVLPLDIVAEIGISALHGLEYAGGFIFHVDETDGSILIATDYSEAGITGWGDIFDLDTNSIIGSGLSNTQALVNGNANDNSVNGVEHDGDYAFKTVLDLEYNNFDDWFIPSRDSMQAIYDKVHALGMGNFNEDLTYWTSTKLGYSPYVMNFNIDWGGSFTWSMYKLKWDYDCKKIIIYSFCL
jgi:hypothetical protein